MPNTSLENKAPALSDTHLQNIISELEAELGVARERQRDLDETRSRIEQLNLQLQQAKRETEEARHAIDILRVENFSSYSTNTVSLKFITHVRIKAVDSTDQSCNPTVE